LAIGVVWVALILATIFGVILVAVVGYPPLKGMLISAAAALLFAVILGAAQIWALKSAKIEIRPLRRN
jgi:hypothetical protein